MPRGVVGERVLDLLLGRLAVDEVGLVDVADEILGQDVVDIAVLVDGEDVTVGIDGAAGGPQDDLASGMGGHPVGDVVDLVAVDDPRLLRLGAVLADLCDAEAREAGIASVGGRGSSGGGRGQGYKGVDERRARSRRPRRPGKGHEAEGGAEGSDGRRGTTRRYPSPRASWTACIIGRGRVSTSAVASRWRGEPEGSPLFLLLLLCCRRRPRRTHKSQ